MSRNIIRSILRLLMIMGVTACAPSLPPAVATEQPATSTAFVLATPPRKVTLTSAPALTITKAIPVTGHLMKPADIEPIAEGLIYDVESSGNAAPYGDSYKINRLERPFRQDMTYVADLDILTFNLSQDTDWYYVSMELKGNDPNNSIGINYGVEIDLNADGFGDYLIWAHPPYTTQWETTTVQVFEDSDHDSAGLSSKQSDAGFGGTGYDTVLFDGEKGENADPDLVWVRMKEGLHATIQFAFKKSWAGFSLMIGVVSDAGLKDVSKFDYNDYLKESDAGSPVRTSPNYPLELLYAVDNTCWQAYGIPTIGYQPKFCPALVLPTATATQRSPANRTPTAEKLPTHEPSPTACESPYEDPELECGDLGYNEETCQCNPEPTEEPEPTDPPTEPPAPTDPPTEPPAPTDPPTEPPATDAPTEPPA